MRNMFGRIAQFVATTSLALALSVGAGTTVANAQEFAPEHLALAREYVDLSDQAKVFEGSLIQAAIGSMRVIIQSNPELETQADEAIGKTLNDYSTRRGELYNQFARIYALRFDMDELREILAFYKTETGAKLLASNTQINRDITQVLQVFQNNLKDEFFAKVRAELKAMGFEI